MWCGGTINRKKKKNEVMIILAVIHGSKVKVIVLTMTDGNERDNGSDSEYIV